MTRESVLNAIRKEIEPYSIKIKGKKKDKSDAFYIIMNTQQVIGTPDEVFHGINNSTLELLKEADIPFEIITGCEDVASSKEEEE